MLITYSQLQPEAQGVVQEVQARFGGLWDTADLGPRLAEDSVFTQDTYALLLEDAIRRINTEGNVAGKNFAIDAYPWDAPIGQATVVASLMVSVIEHFVLSFTESPSFSGMTGPELDRSQYGSRWKDTLALYQTKFTNALAAFDQHYAGKPFATSQLVWATTQPYGYSERVRPSRPSFWR